MNSTLDSILLRYFQIFSWTSTGTLLILEEINLLTISSVYLPPKYTAKQEQLEDFYNTLGRRFIAGGGYNAKHTDWGSRLITPRGREVLKTLERNNLEDLSTGEPTYWSYDRNKLPDLVDFCVTKDFAVANLFFWPTFRSFSGLDHTNITCA
jgi:hypothetical protein